MIVCICHRVSDRDIVREARAGCASFDELQDELRVGTGCGACLDCAKATFADASGAATAVHCHRAVPRPEVMQAA
ncbi:MAG: (2Fe-2S)-binding protein [Burkholderiales bacterium]|nr:(2Fe-2S)-binding protein [Burkholderiales bacterium]